MNKNKKKVLTETGIPNFKNTQKPLFQLPNMKGFILKEKKTRRLNGLPPRGLPPDRNVWHGGTRNARNWVFP